MSSDELRGVVLRTQATAPPGLLEDWARARSIELRGGRRRARAAARRPTSKARLRGRAGVREVAGGRPAAVGARCARLAARRGRRVPARARDLLRRAGARRRARRLRAPPRRARDRLGRDRDRRRRARPAGPVAGVARGRLHAAAAGLRARSQRLRDAGVLPPPPPGRAVPSRGDAGDRRRLGVVAPSRLRRDGHSGRRARRERRSRRGGRDAARGRGCSTASPPARASRRASRAEDGRPTRLSGGVSPMAARPGVGEIRSAAPNSQGRHA